METKEISITHSCLNENGKIFIVDKYNIPNDCDDILNYIDGIDKKEWMVENDILLIKNYWITEIKPKKKKQTFKLYLKSYFTKTDKILTDDFKDKYVGDILSVYNKMKYSLVKLSNKKKLDIILSMVETNYINGDTKELLNKLK